MTQTIQLAVQKDNVNLINQALNSNQPTKIAAEEGMKISLVEAKTGLPAKKLKAKKVDDDLLIADENGETLLTIEDYYLTDNIQLGTVGDSGFVEFDYVNYETGVTSQIASETSYTTLVSEMLSDTSFIGGISNGVLLGSLGAAALGIAALSSGSSDDSSKTPANKIPVSKDSIITATEDTIVSGKLEAATDADGDTLTYAIATGATSGQVVIGKDGSYSYTPNANFNGKDSFTYTINDGQGGVITQTATVNVAPVNDAPEITALEKQGFSSTDINYQSSGKGHGHMAVTEDGKIVVAGQSNEHGMIIQRFYQDGSLDRDFGENGIAIAGSVFSDDIRDILVTEDGKILITAADGYGASEKDFLIGRFNSDGSIDNSFADNGVIQMDFDGDRDSAYNLVPLDGGRFLVTGLGTNFKGNKGVLLTVFDSDGNLDSSFNPSGTGTGQPGVVHYDKFSAGMYYIGSDTSEASLVTHDGNIVVAIKSNYGLVLTKFNQEGELLASNVIESQLYSNFRIKEGADGKLIIGADLGSKSIGVARFNSDLTQDITFNTRVESMQDVIDGELVDIEYEVGGDIYTGFEGDNQFLIFTDLQLLDDGKILVTGQYRYSDDASAEYSYSVFFSKYNADGTLDKSFNSEGDFRGKPGVLVTDFELGADGYSVQYDIEITSSGEILLFGVVENQEQRSFDSILVKFDINGNQISDFGPAIGIKATQDSDLIMKVDDFNFSDSDGNQLKAVIIDTLPESGDLLLNGASISTGQVIDVSLIESGKLIYRSETDIKNDQDININYRVQDNGGTENGGVDISEQGTLVIKVIFSNNIPVSKDSIIAATEDNAVSGKLEAATDADGDTLTYAIATGAANGKVVIGKDGSYSYTPNANFNGKDSFTYTIDDGQGGIITQTATVNVEAVNDAPVSEDSVIGVAENIVDTGKLAEATDVDGDDLTYALKEGAANGTVTVNADGSYSYTPNTDFKGEDSFTYTVDDGNGGIITKTANVKVSALDQKSNFELQEVFETNIVSEQQTVVEKQADSYISDFIEFEVTGNNAMPQLELTNGSNIIQGSYYYNLQSTGVSASGSSGFSSVGSNTSSIDLGVSTLPPGIYTLDFYVDSPGSLIDFSITEFKDVEKTNFTGYQEVTGNIFADDNGNINTPENYEIKIDGQSLVFEAGNPVASPITIDTDNGKLTVAADGSYSYRSDRNDLGLEAEKLAEEFYVKVIDLDTKQASHYGIDITSDTTPPEPGELVFNNFEDTGISKDDGVTQDDTFDLTVQGNEAGSQVEYQYSTDQGATWQVLANGTASDLADGDYSFRAKVTDEALNESFTAVKDITIDTTAPILGQILNFNTATNQLEVNADIDQDTLQAYKSENGALTPLDDATNIPFAEGNYQIQASDIAGNSSILDFTMATASGEYKPSADGIDVVKGSAGNDYLYGGNGDDILISNGGSDRLYGEAGNDTLIFGGNSSDRNTFYGGEGNDTYVIDVNKFSNGTLIQILDFSGSNKLELKGIDPSEITLTRNDSMVYISTPNGQIILSSQLSGGTVDNIYFDDGTVWDKATIDAMVAPKIVGTDTDDTITLTSEHSALYGLDGNDTLKGGVNNDYLYGGNGDDILISNGGSDRLYGEAGNDTLIFGGNSSDRNTFYGGEGNDTYVIDVNKFSNGTLIQILDFSGSNKLELKGIDPSEITLTRNDSMVYISTPNGQIILSSQLSGGTVDNIYFDDGTVWDKATIEDMVNSGNSNARSMMSFDVSEATDDNYSISEDFIDLSTLDGDADVYHDNNAAPAFSSIGFNTQMSTVAESQQVELPNIDDLLDVNNDELVFESADTVDANIANETATTSVSSGASEPSTAVDFTIGQVQALNDNMQAEAMFHIMQQSIVYSN